MRYEAEPIVPMNLHTNHGLNMIEDKRVIDASRDCHGNLASIAMRYVADAYSLKRTSIPNMNSIRLKTKELQSKMCFTQTPRLRLIGLIK